MILFEFFCGLLFLAGLIGIPVFVIVVLTGDWGRTERIEEAMQYDPNPIHGQGRFASPDDLRKAGW
jgi:hypothetical protein